MNRYTQGFYKFGPMEQSSTGEWIKFSDHKLETSKLSLTVLEKTGKYLAYKDKNERLVIANKQLTIIAYGFAGIILLLMTALNYTLD